MPSKSTGRENSRGAARKARKKVRAGRTSGPVETGSVRLQKILAAAGLGSRRGAEELIRTGRVSVNGRPASLGDSADPFQDRITLDGERIQLEKPRYWVLNKPVGIVTTVRDPHGRKTVMQLLPNTAGPLHPVGRLDRDSAGLLLLTNDGDLTQKLLHPSHQSEKEYRVIVKGEVQDRTLERLRRGVRLEDGPSAPVQVGLHRFESATQTTTLLLTMTEGRKRQLRRILLQLGHPVRRLVRVRVGPLKLGRLAVGESRPLRREEIRTLKSYADRLKRVGTRGRRRRAPTGSAR